MEEAVEFPLPEFRLVGADGKINREFPPQVLGIDEDPGEGIGRTGGEVLQEGLLVGLQFFLDGLDKPFPFKNTVGNVLQIPGGKEDIDGGKDQDAEHPEDAADHLNPEGTEKGREKIPEPGEPRQGLYPRRLYQTRLH
jgi:hypothetical protein